MTEAQHKTRIILLVATPIIGVIAAMILLWNRYVFPLDIALLLILYPTTAMGITIGYHRMLTHQGFETHPIVKGFFLILGCMAFVGVPNEWAATHIKHHAHSDDEDDPHSPLEGFWHAHFGWLFSLKNFPEVEEYAPHLLKDKTVQFVNRTALFWMGFSLALPAIIGGWTGFIWGGLVRIFVVNHVTWSVNSVCHSFGRRPFETTDESRNEWVVGLLAFGEGWHNNHHAFPRSALHGLKWWQFDMSGLIIRGLEKLGLVWNVQRVTEETMEAKMRKAEGLRAALADFQAQLIANIAGAKKDLADLLVNARKRLPEPAQQRLRAAHDEGVRRLEELQRRIAERHSMKKRKMEEYREEIRSLVESAKKKMQQEIGRRVAAVS